MGLFDRFFKKPPVANTVPRTQEIKPAGSKKKSAKDIANERGEPYIGILSFDIHPEDINAGSFELDWNDKFIANLVRAGYQMKPNEPEDVIVDRWFQNICRNVVMETYEQEQAMNPSRYVESRNLGNGRREVS